MKTMKEITMKEITMNKITTALLAVLLMVLAGCQSFPSAPGSGSRLIDSFTRPLTSGAEATTGPVMFVGAFTILMGVIALFGFKKIGSGIGMIFTGFGISMMALWLRDYAGFFLLVSVLLGIGYGVWLLTDESKRRKMRKKAKWLFAQGRKHEARALEKEAEE
jgi:hypothetical protein